MDETFLDAWMIAAVADEQQYDSPFLSLARILCKAPSIAALRIKIAEPSGSRSGWRKFGLASAGGISFATPLFAALPLLESGGTCRPAKISILPALKCLELDGFQDFEAVLRLTPNLDTLRLVISAGYSQHVNTELISSLRHVPKLRNLVYTPNTLRAQTERDGTGNGSRGVLLEIAGLLPQLETLDLQTRHHRHSIYFCSSSEPIPPNVSRAV